MILAEIPGHYGELTEILTLPPEEWAPGIWAGSEGMRVELRKIFKVETVDMKTRTVVLKPYTQIHNMGYWPVDNGLGRMG